MIEQQLAERFRAVVGDEPPLGFDPDQFVDRLFRRRRRRQAFGAALGVIAVATAAVAGVTTFGDRGGAPAPPGYGVAARPTTTTATTGAPRTTDLNLTNEYVDPVTSVLPPGKFAEFPVTGGSDVDRVLYHLTVETDGSGQGLVQVRLDDVIAMEVELSPADRRDFPLKVPIAVPAGGELTVLLSCAKAAAADGLCRATVAFQFGPVDR